MTQSGRLVAVGGSVGLIVSLAVLSILKALLRLDNVSVLDAGAFATSVALIGAAAGIATYYPARRASHIDPASGTRDRGTEMTSARRRRWPGASESRPPHRPLARSGHSKFDESEEARRASSSWWTGSVEEQDAVSEHGPRSRRNLA